MLFIWCRFRGEWLGVGCGCALCEIPAVFWTKRSCCRPIAQLRPRCMYCTLYGVTLAWVDNLSGASIIPALHGWVLCWLDAPTESCLKHDSDWCGGRFGMPRVVLEPFFPSPETGFIYLMMERRHLPYLTLYQALQFTVQIGEPSPSGQIRAGDRKAREGIKFRPPPHADFHGARENLEMIWEVRQMATLSSSPGTLNVCLDKAGERES